MTITGSAITNSVQCYASASDVAGLCRNLLGPYSNFTTSTSPNLDVVNSWLSSGCSILESKISDMGYGVPIISSTTLFSWLRDLNALYAASRAEMSRSNVTLAPGERTRGQVFDEMFWKQLKQFESMNLVSIGAVRITSSDGVGLFIGGLTQSSKDTYSNDSDVLQARFKRDMLTMDGSDSAEYTESVS
jgi:hypothetical protein